MQKTICAICDHLRIQLCRRAQLLAPQRRFKKFSFPEIRPFDFSIVFTKPPAWPDHLGFSGQFRVEESPQETSFTSLGKICAICAICGFNSVPQPVASRPSLPWSTVPLLSAPPPHQFPSILTKSPRALRSNSASSTFRNPICLDLRVLSRSICDVLNVFTIGPLGTRPSSPQPLGPSAPARLRRYSSGVV